MVFLPSNLIFSVIFSVCLSSDNYILYIIIYVKNDTLFLQNYHMIYKDYRT